MKKKKEIKKLLKAVESDPDVNAVILFGSTAREEDKSNSDMDICLVLKKGRYDNKQLSYKKLEYLKLFPFDIQVFQQLPLYIRVRVLKDGSVIFCRDEDEVYNIAFRTVEEFSDFEYIYRSYLKEVANVR